MLALKSPPQVPASHTPHCKTPPQPSPFAPQSNSCSAQVNGVQGDEPHTPGKPPPPQVPASHSPHWMRFPQPSPATPQVYPCSRQLSGGQTGPPSSFWTTQEERSKSMNSKTFSWAVIGPLVHSLGKSEPKFPVLFSTWKSE